MASPTTEQRVYNFSAGPAVLPVPVLEQIRDEMLCLPGAGCSLLEISHRDKAYDAIHNEAIEVLTELLAIPESHTVMFIQGGSRLQFSMVPLNFQTPGGACDYIVSGTWGKQAASEAKKVETCNVVWNGSETNFDRLPDTSQLEFTSNADFVHFTSNETIQGVQFASPPVGAKGPLVCDASSDFLSRPLNIADYGLIYACAQKNAGPSGVTVVVAEKELLSRASDDLPGYMQYKNHFEANSLYNTPPTFGVYVVGLVAKWLRDQIGGLDAMAKQNAAKAKILYDVIDDSNGFYLGHAQPDCRSVMNVAFRMETEELDQKFLTEAKSHQLTTLKGHRSVGGIRASIYNAMPVEGVETLRDFMKDFASKNA